MAAAETNMSAGPTSWAGVGGAFVTAPAVLEVRGPVVSTPHATADPMLVVIAKARSIARHRALLRTQSIGLGCSKVPSGSSHHCGGVSGPGTRASPPLVTNSRL